MAVKLSPEEQERYLTDLKVAMESTQKIAAIKAVRAISVSLGLAEAKKLVEEAAAKHGWTTNAFECVQHGLMESLDIVFTKEQFMSMVSAAYDAHKDLFEDPLSSVLHALKNLQAKGGLKYAAMKDQHFIDSI